MTTLPPVDLAEPDSSPGPEAEANVLAQAYLLILSWPCPLCGQPFPCAHDLAEDPDGPGKAGDESQPDFNDNASLALVELAEMPLESAAH